MLLNQVLIRDIQKRSEFKEENQHTAIHQIDADGTRATMLVSRASATGTSSDNASCNSSKAFIVCITSLRNFFVFFALQQRLKKIHGWGNRQEAL